MEVWDNRAVVLNGGRWTIWLGKGAQGEETGFRAGLARLGIAKLGFFPQSRPTNTKVFPSSSCECFS